MSKTTGLSFKVGWPSRPVIIPATTGRGAILGPIAASLRMAHEERRYGDIAYGPYDLVIMYITTTLMESATRDLCTAMTLANPRKLATWGTPGTIIDGVILSADGGLGWAWERP